jgi:hypothetical protein
MLHLTNGQPYLAGSCDETAGSSVINCCYAASGIRVSLTMTKIVDCPDLTFSNTHRNVADGKISLKVSRRLVSPACIAGGASAADCC